MDESTRRTVLRLGVGSGLAALSGCQVLSGSDGTDSDAPPESTPVGAEESTGSPPEQTPEVADGDAPVGVRGALYLPARAWNTYQMYSGYDRSVIERDLGYAERLNLNAIRTWVNYEYWKEAPKKHGKRFEHLLSAAEERGIRVLAILFEGVGEQPTEENLHNRDPLTATTVASPSGAVVANPDRWGKPREFVRWFFERWGGDDRLLGVEVMNEPGWSKQNVQFSRGMFKTMKEHRESVPLTVGSTSVINDLRYDSWGADALQFHYNFPQSQRIFRDAVEQTRVVASQVDQPVWLTEWQRVRSGEGFHSAPKPDERAPNYSSMAPIIRELGVGNFFWSLMIKPAVVQSQRKHGILNGVFHEDGAVWDLDDARAIKSMSGDRSFEAEERKEWPEWAAEIKEQASGSS